MWFSLKRIVIGVPLILLWYCSFSVALEQSCLDMFSTEMNIIPNNGNEDVRTLVKSFCNWVEEMRCEYDGDFYDAKQSVFLNILCENVWASYWGAIIGKLKKSTFLQFKIYDYGYWEDDEIDSEIDQCNYKQIGMNWCNLAKFLPKIFDPLMNDFFNIRHASIFWVADYNDDFDKTEVANQYSMKVLPWLSSQTNYKLSKWICSPETDYYKKTCKYLKNYVKKVRKLINKTQIIDIKKLSEYGKDIDCENNFTWDVLYCGLLWNTIKSDTLFLNAVYNEYFWYSLFMSHYANMLASNSKYGDSWSSNWTKSVSNIIEDNIQKSASVSEQLAKSKQAISMSLIKLSQISTSFPLHLGFMMYQEDAKLFMNKVWKIYSPIRTLYDKLRNAQIKEE